jgi:Glycosyl transferase family 2
VPVFRYSSFVQAGTASRAAARGDHVTALSACETPPLVVQSILGLHQSVVRRSQSKSASDRLYTAIAHAELGNVTGALDAVGGSLSRLRAADRARLSLILARWSPDTGLKLAGRTQPLVNCALALRSGDFEQARRWLARCDRMVSADRDGLSSALAARSGDHRLARSEANRAFRHFGLHAPLDDQINTPIHLGAFSAPRHVHAGGPRVSVIMPVRNAQATVAVAIRSVLSQSWHNLELIVINDASTDETAACAKRAIQDDDRARLVSLPAQSGAYGARNAGLRLATGTFVTFNDADDWSHPERIARGVAPLLDGADLQATQSRLIRLGGDGAFTAPRVFPLVRANPSSLLFRRAILSELGGFEEVAFGADEEFTGRIVARYGPAAIRRLSALLAVASQHTTSLTGATATGLDCRDGLNRRIGYREAWHGRHLENFKTMRSNRASRPGPGGVKPWQLGPEIA